MSSRSGRLLYAAMVIVLVIVGMRSILALPIFTIQPKISLFRSLILSWRFSKRDLLKLLGLIAMLVTVLLLVMLGITLISTWPLYMLERLIPSTALVTAGITIAF